MGYPSNKAAYNIGDQVGNCIYLGENFSNNWKQYAKFKCICRSEFIAVIYRVKSGHTKTCGCLIAKRNKDRLTSHGMTKSKEYNTWINLIQRCTNPNNDHFHRYGGRGITICESWLESFENFYNDMGSPASLRHSIERIENELGYCKENCKWELAKAQSNNRSTNLKITYNNETMTLKQWTEKLNLDYYMVHQRIKKLNWSITRAFETKQKWQRAII